MKEDKIKSLPTEELQKKKKQLTISMLFVFVIMILTGVALVLLSEDNGIDKALNLIPIAFIPYILTAFIMQMKIKKEIENRTSNIE